MSASNPMHPMASSSSTPAPSASMVGRVRSVHHPATLVPPPAGRGESDTLALDTAVALDAVQFAVDAGITPDPWQAQILRSAALRVLLNCSRQSGKSTTTTTTALHQALYERDSLMLLPAPSQRQSQELFNKHLQMVV